MSCVAENFNLRIILGISLRLKFEEIEIKIEIPFFSCVSVASIYIYFFFYKEEIFCSGKMWNVRESKDANSLLRFPAIFVCFHGTLNREEKYISNNLCEF